MMTHFGSSFKKYNRSGIDIFEVTTEVAQLRNQPICLADGNVLFRKKMPFDQVKYKRRGNSVLRF